MPGKPPQPPPSEPPGSEAGGSDAISDGERLGPLTIERHRKADGRALILYSRADATAR